LDGLEGFLTHITIGDKDIFNSFLMGLASRLVGIFEIDGRLCIGIGDGSASVLFRQRNNLRGGDIRTFNPTIVIPWELRDLMILTLEASEIAPHRGHGEGGRPRKEMEEWLLFNRVYIQRDCTAIDKGIKLSFPVLSYSTESPFQRGDNASMIAKDTLDLPVL
jgi:hypothetical protein